jgi:hypothetical protein
MIEPDPDPSDRLDELDWRRRADELDELAEVERLLADQDWALAVAVGNILDEVQDALLVETIAFEDMDAVISSIRQRALCGDVDLSQPIPSELLVGETLTVLVARDVEDQLGDVPVVSLDQAAEMAGVSVTEYLRCQAAADARSFPVREPTGRPPGRPPTGTDDVAATVELLEEVSGLTVVQLRALLKRRGAARMPLALAVARIRADSLATPPALADALQCSERAIERLVALSVGQPAV